MFEAVGFHFYNGDFFKVVAPAIKAKEKSCDDKTIT